MVLVMHVFGLLVFSKPTRRLTHQPPTSAAALVALLLLFFKTSLGALAILMPNNSISRILGTQVSHLTLINNRM